MKSVVLVTILVVVGLSYVSRPERHHCNRVMCATADGAALPVSDAAPKALNKLRFDPIYARPVLKCCKLGFPNLNGARQ